jgi:hypothetical protein
VSPARGRDYAAEYAARKAKAEQLDSTVYSLRVSRGQRRGYTTRQAAGRASTAEPSASQLGAVPRTLPFLGEPGEVVDRELTAAQARRASRANRLDRLLRDGDITPDEFRRRKSRMAPIAGVKPLADPATALALLIVTPSEDWRYVGPNAGGTTRR